MLDKSKVLLFIKFRLGYPHVVLELSDDDMWDYIRMFTLDEFSKYKPDTQEMTLNLKDSENKTDDQRVFLIHEPDGCRILNVSDVIYPEADLWVMGYPYQAELASYSSIASDVQAVEQAETVEQFSRMNPSFNFYEPNRLRLYRSMLPDKVIIRYERVQPESLMYINPEYEPEFLYLCLADIMTICGNIRTKYSSMSTPFGEIQINGDFVNGGEQLKSNVTARLETLWPNKAIYVG